MRDRPFIVPVFIPHAGCLHRCVFCNQSAVTGRSESPRHPDQWQRHVREFLRFRSIRRGWSQIAFFGGNFLGLSEDRLHALLGAAAQWVRNGDVNGIRFSTRPDTVDQRMLDILAAYPVQTVELGAQSMDDEVLRQSRRGHTPDDTVAAVERLRERGYEVGLQVMVGLPGDDQARMMETGRRIAALAPNFVRIYPTLVLSGSPLEAWYRHGRYRPLSIDTAVAHAAWLYRLFRAQGIAVIRMGLQPTRDLNPDGAVKAGPFHPAFGQLVQSACFLDALRRQLHRTPLPAGRFSVRVHPRSVSRMRGTGNGNCVRLRQEFGFSAVDVLADPRLAEDVIALPNGETAAVYEAIDPF